MNAIEKELIVEILKFKTDNKKIENLIKKNDINWPDILGFISYHRIAGLVYEKMNSINIRLLEYPVFFSTYMINQAQKIRSDKQLEEIKKISQKFNEYNIKHIFLKGTILNQTVFKPGSRASNDIDILISKKSINKATTVLKKLGFVQGKYNYKKNIIEKYSDEELKESLIKKGETCPFIKKTNESTIKTIDVDLNFSLDWTPDYNQSVIDDILNNGSRLIIDNKYTICSANIYDNLIELCIHLYKDMALIDIVKKRKIFDLYKFIDIYYFINTYYDKIDFYELELEIKKFNAQKYVFFALKYLIEIFDDFSQKNILLLLNKLEENINDKKILDTIFDQYDPNNRLISNSNLKERIFKYNIINEYKGENQ